jgi:hypothetical protein
LIDLPLDKCSRRIRAIVSTTSIPHRPRHKNAGSRTERKLQGQFWTPISPPSGSKLHAETQLDNDAQPQPVQGGKTATTCWM